MANYYRQTVVHQTIPNDCMAPIERWLLTHIFDHEPYGDGLYFFAEEFPGSEQAYADEQLFEAIEASSGCCPELCAAVQQAIRRGEDEVTVDLDVIGYDAIFQSIVKRHPNRLPYISIEASISCSRMRPDGFGGSATLITPDTVESFETGEWLYERLTARKLKFLIGDSG